MTSVLFGLFFGFPADADVFYKNPKRRNSLIRAICPAGCADFQTAHLFYAGLSLGLGFRPTLRF